MNLPYCTFQGSEWRSAPRFCSLGTIVVLGSVSPLLTLAAEVMFFKRHKFRYSIHTFGSLAITVVGVVLYALFQYQIEAQFVGIIALAKGARGFCVEMGLVRVTTDFLVPSANRYLMVEDPIDINDGGMMVSRIKPLHQISRTLANFNAELTSTDLSGVQQCGDAGGVHRSDDDIQ
eukprot:1329937-Amorphochlora_amoeboformis.AAC.2